ncbi:MAG TPA: DoxX family protein [Candidatus Sulfotelmatobacter sp.]
MSSIASTSNVLENINDQARAEENTTNTNRSLWSLQVILAAAFLFTGAIKLILPAAVLPQQSHLPGIFMKSLGLAETHGALALMLPGLFQIGRGLTFLVATGLVIIIVGATVVTVAAGEHPGATPIRW